MLSLGVTPQNFFCMGIPRREVVPGGVPVHMIDISSPRKLAGNSKENRMFDLVLFYCSFEFPLSSCCFFLFVMQPAGRIVAGAKKTSALTAPP